MGCFPWKTAVAVKVHQLETPKNQPQLAKNKRYFPSFFLPEFDFGHSGSNDESKAIDSTQPHLRSEVLQKVVAFFFRFCATKKSRDVVLTPEKSQKSYHVWRDFSDGARGVETKQNMLAN